MSTVEPVADVVVLEDVEIDDVDDWELLEEEDEEDEGVVLEDLLLDELEMELVCEEELALEVLELLDVVMELEVFWATKA